VWTRRTGVVPAASASLTSAWKVRSSTTGKITSRTTLSGASVTADATLNRMPALPRTVRASSISSATTLRSALTVIRWVMAMSNSTSPSTISASRGSTQAASSGNRMRVGCRRSSHALSTAARRRSRLAASG
jgi:hypothetical protein